MNQQIKEDKVDKNDRKIHNTIIEWNENSLTRKHKTAVILTTRHFDRFSLQCCTALHTLLMMTAESMLSERTVLRIAVTLVFSLQQNPDFVLSYESMYLFFTGNQASFAVTTVTVQFINFDDFSAYINKLCLRFPNATVSTVELKPVHTPSLNGSQSSRAFCIAIKFLMS